MLQRTNRLSAVSEIERVFRNGRSVRSRLVGCKIAYKNEGPVRFAFVVGTKISKSAVARNRIRRRLREIIRPLLPEIFRPADVMLLAQTSALKATFPELKNDVLTLLVKGGLLSPKL